MRLDISSRKRKSAINIIVALFSNVLIALLSLFTSRVIKQRLGLEVLGINGVFSNVITLLNLTELGICTAITFALYKPLSENDMELIKAIMSFYKKAYRIIAIVVGILGLCILPFIKFFVKSNTYSDLYLCIAYLLFLANTVLSYLLVYKRTIIVADQKNYVISLVTLVFTIILKFIQVMVVEFTSNYLLFLLVAIVCTLCNNIYISICADKLYPYLKENKAVEKLPPSEKNQILTKIKALFLHSLGTVVVFGTDNILVSYFSGISDAGRYTSYVAIINMFATFITVIFDNVKDSVGNFFVISDKNSKFDLFVKMLFLNHSIIYISSICLLVLGETFVCFWLGSEAILGHSIFILLILNFILSKGNMVVGTFKNSAGFFEQDRFVPIIEGFMNLVCSIFLAKKFGTIGIVLGTSISTFLGPFWIQPYIIYKHIFQKNIVHYIFIWGRDFCVFLINLALIFLLSEITKNLEKNFGLFIVKAIVIFVSTVIAWSISFAWNKEFRYFASLLLRKGNLWKINDRENKEV